MIPPVPTTLGAKLGLAATVLLVPGGSLIAAAVLWRWWQERRE